MGCIVDVLPATRAFQFGFGRLTGQSTACQLKLMTGAARDGNATPTPRGKRTHAVIRAEVCAIDAGIRGKSHTPGAARQPMCVFACAIEAGPVADRRREHPGEGRAQTQRGRQRQSAPPPSVKRAPGPLSGRIRYVAGHSALLHRWWSDRDIAPSDQDVSDEEVVDDGGDYAADNRRDNRYPEVDIYAAVPCGPGTVDL